MSEDNKNENPQENRIEPKDIPEPEAPSKVPKAEETPAEEAKPATAQEPAEGADGRDQEPEKEEAAREMQEDLGLQEPTEGTDGRDREPVKEDAARETQEDLDQGEPQGDPYQQNQQGPQGDPYQQNQQGPQGGPYQQNQQGPQGDPYQQNQQGPQGGPYQQNQWGPQGGPYQQNQWGPQGGPYQQNQWGPQGGPYENRPPYRQYPPKRSNSLSIAALILGILSIFGSCCGIGGLIFGSFGIVLAILSRGQKPMETQAKVGLGLSIAGMILGLIVTIFCFASIRSYEFRQYSMPYSYDSHNNGLTPYNDDDLKEYFREYHNDHNPF